VRLILCYHNLQMTKGEKNLRIRGRELLAALAAFACAFGNGCFSSERGETYYGRIVVPQRQELRWSNGGLPRVFDPAMAQAAPDTDAVRATFEGLTELDSRTLAPVQAVAIEWTSSRDFKEWTFHLRPDARWSNGEPVTAEDFARSWLRATRLGGRAPHGRLLDVIEGARLSGLNNETVAQPDNSTTPGAAITEATPELNERPSRFGAEAIGDHTLRVRLSRSVPDFPALVAHPVFRPIYRADVEMENLLREEIVTNGAFRLGERTGSEVVLERAANYWNVSSVRLERVRFVATASGEAALAAYRRGEIDAITNASFAPLALRLLTPYRDFRRATFGAVNYYVFNMTRAPFSDIRVREALAIAIDRERLTRDRTGGATEPARRFLPRPTDEVGHPSNDVLNNILRTDLDRARRLLAEAGFPGGVNFPPVRLLMNRNEQQRVVAEAIRQMWRNALGIDTEIIVKDWNEYETALRAGDYDIARRSMVMQTTDETTNMLLMFDVPSRRDMEISPNATGEASPSPQPSPDAGASVTTTDEGIFREQTIAPSPLPQMLTAEREAFAHLPAIPLYFSSSYALVKPYVAGFDSNLLDAPDLRRVRIETNWQPPHEETQIRIARSP
jgi:oligopeptide transport system substrate-binding protein